MSTPSIVYFSPSVHLLHPLLVIAEEIVTFKEFDLNSNQTVDTKVKIQGSVQLCALSSAIIVESQIKRTILQLLDRSKETPFVAYTKLCAKRDFTLGRVKEFTSTFLVDLDKDFSKEINELKILGGLRNVIAHGHQFEHDLLLSGNYLTVKESDEKRALLDDLIKAIPAMEKYKKSSMAFTLMFEEREIARWSVLLLCTIVKNLSSLYGGINDYEMQYIEKLEQIFQKM